MTLKDFFLAQLDAEAALTRKAVERVPEGHNDFKPHERSMDLGYLAALVAGMPGWIAFMIDRDELDLSDESSAGFRTKPLATKGELLASLDKGVAASKRALQATTDEHLMTPWLSRWAATLCRSSRGISCCGMRCSAILRITGGS